ncbi:MAG: deoA [Rhodospirillales bacterium]|nr:deoA [Rhodospirillales bacterium]
MLPQEIIRRKRDGTRLSQGELRDFTAGIADGRIGEGQMAAFAMAALLNGLDEGETAALTRAMARSGVTLDWSGEMLGGPVLDKHSTGGVGDKVSLILAAIIAACGGFVPMLAGHGLGHTGGTLDKLAAIPGYQTQLEIARLRRVVKSVGCAIVGATDDLAPADRRLYAVRDVTATVESIPLITASILSKKLAAGLDGLVMDVKVGSGAFMTDEAQAEALAGSLVATASDCGLKVTALVTDMNEVLGRSAGNALEVLEALALLRDGTGDEKLATVTLALAAELLHLGGISSSLAAGKARAGRALGDGSAAEHFARMVAALGGPSDIVDAPDRHFEAAPVRISVEADRSSRIGAIDVRAIGMAIVGLGGGRTRAGQAIDHAVGLTDIARIGELTGPGERPLAVVHARDAQGAFKAGQEIQAAFTLLSRDAPGQPPPPLFVGRIAT